MRTPIAVLVAYLVIPCACGGGQATREVAQSPDNATAPGGTGGGTPEPGPSLGTTTTTVAEAGDTQGVKLPEVRPSASTAASAAVPPKAAHTHDPGRGQSDIGAIVSAHKDEARACYDKALADHPGIEGDLVVSWTIDPKGNVVQTSLDTSRSQIVEPTVATCIEAIIKKIQFAPSPGGFETKASYPFNFRPRHGKATP
jgi:outer membrane biosynthesis protein TonB